MTFLGRNHTFIVAEIGSNHNCSVATAKELIRVAAESGCDAAKFQLWQADLMFPKDTTQYLDAVRHQLPLGWLPMLAYECDKQKIEFLCSVFDEPSASAVNKHVNAHKIANIEATWSPFVDFVLAMGKPTMISNGTLIEAEIDALRLRARGHEVYLLHCLTAYPAPLDQMSLGEMRHQGVGFTGYGLSDHTMDPVIAPIVAVALGAVVIEKHVTLSRTSAGPDHRYALEPGELAAMVRAIREAEAAMVLHSRPRESERGYLSYRRGPQGLRGQ